MELRIKEAVWRFGSVYASIFDRVSSEGMEGRCLGSRRDLTCGRVDGHVVCMYQTICVAGA